MKQKQLLDKPQALEAPSDSLNQVVRIHGKKYT